ncbi:MAG: spore maturation protein [Clostridia bacterium]|nr:spore maturation protein [Clostridia bacterium]
MEKISSLIIPFVLCIFALITILSKKDMYSVFINGAKEGAKTALNLIYPMIILMSAIYMLNASGATSAIGSALSPILNLIGIPEEIVPLILVRPISGSAATAILNDIFFQYGASSFAGRCASVIAGCTDTVIYTVSIYFAAAKLYKTRHTILCASLTQFFAIIISCIAVKILF